MCCYFVCWLGMRAHLSQIGCGKVATAYSALKPLLSHVLLLAYVLIVKAAEAASVIGTPAVL